MLSEWHLTPEYIDNNWTDEIFLAMLLARVDRMKRVKDTPPSEPHKFNDGKYHPEHHADVTSLAGKMFGFGSSAFKITKVNNHGN